MTIMSIEQLREAALNLLTMIDDVGFLLGPDMEDQAMEHAVNLCLAIGCTPYEIESNVHTGE